MLLCLDVGNSHIFGGVFDGNEIKLRFRYASGQIGTSDQFGLFFREVLRENEINPHSINAIAMCSVVPSLDYSITAACIKYFSIEPFVLKAGVKTGLQIKVQNPQEMGADLIANAIAAIDQFPDHDLMILDFGTATTVCSLSAQKEYLGCVIMPGLKTSVASLEQNAAKLPPVDIVKLRRPSIKSTISSIQTGIYFGQLGALREIITRLSNEIFHTQKSFVLATGGFSHLYDDQDLFNVHSPDLALHGLRIAWQRNQ